MKKFELIESESGVSIRHATHPECEIEVIELESEACWQGGWGDIFDLYQYRNGSAIRLFQFIITDYYEVGIMSADDVGESELPAYKLLLKKSWKFFLNKFLLGDELKFQPRKIILESYDEDGSDFGYEEESGVRYVYHRQFPIFRAKLKKEQSALGILDELEFLEDHNLSETEIAGLLRKMGDWIAKTKFN